MATDGGMFLGEYQHSLDPKGRVIFPAAYREQLGEGLVMTVGVDNCITVHPVPEWERVIDGLRRLRSTDRRERMFTRMMTSMAHPDELDRQGRVTIPVRLRQYANLDRDVTVVGADTKIELWDTARWEAYRDQAMADFAQTDHPFDLGGF
ncbi:MAG TPA: division/cell wall cluster transcriptional repressor MraZ [Euzebyales bacterium]|nr:division/cell wall cluster transcriptional repressor MraZ [Euzebyales bacterium]